MKPPVKTAQKWGLLGLKNPPEGLEPQPEPNPELAWEAIDKLLVDDDVPAGARTIADWAKIHRVPYKTAEGQVRNLFASGVLRMGRKRVKCGSRSGIVNHYWPA